MSKRLYLMLCARTLKREPLFQIAHKIGRPKEVMTIYDYLDRSPELISFPPKVRRKYILKQILEYSRGRDIGSHIPGFYPFLASPSAWPKYPDLQYLEGLAPPQTILPVIDRHHHKKPVSGISLGLHIHAFTLNGLTHLRDAIISNQTLPHLFITGPEVNRSAVVQIFSSYAKKMTFVACDNVGRDVVPFLRLLPIMRRAGHDLIGHAHVKQSSHLAKDFVRAWSDNLISSLVGNTEQCIAAIDDIAYDFISSEEKPSIYLPHSAKPSDWKINGQIAEKIFSTLHSGPLPERYLFSAGTMFWATPRYLRNFEEVDLPWSELVSEPLPEDGTVLHAIERLFGALAVTRQDKIVICPASDLSFVFSPRLFSSTQFDS